MSITHLIIDIVLQFLAANRRASEEPKDVLTFKQLFIYIYIYILCDRVYES